MPRRSRQTPTKHESSESSSVDLEVKASIRVRELETNRERRDVRGDL